MNSDRSATRWHVYADTHRLVEEVVRAIGQRAADSITLRGDFRVVLAGGMTPQRIYAALRDLDTDWLSWRVFFGDERCLPVGDPDRNDTMAHNTWLDRVPISPAAIHSIPAELGPEEGASRYRQILDGSGDFDLTLLGLGEDGHTASLFPGHDIGVTDDAEDVLAVGDAPKLPAERVSLSAHRLSRSTAVYFLVVGASKREAVLRLRAGDDIPASRIRAVNGVDVFADRTAAA